MMTSKNTLMLVPGGRAGLDEIRKVSDLLGTDIMNRANEHIADLEDVVMSPQGEPLYAILGYGGIAGVGEKYTAIPWDMLTPRFVDRKWAANLDITSDALKKAPTFQNSDYRDLTNARWVTSVRQFFGNLPGQARQPVREPEAEANRALQYVLRASKVIDAPLKGADNESIGEVEDLLFDKDGRVAFAILGKGGVLNIGEDYIPVPWSALRIKYDREDTSVSTSIDMTNEQLRRAPLVKGDDYATLLAPGFTDQVYRYFHVDPKGVEPGSPPAARP